MSPQPRITFDALSILLVDDDPRVRGTLTRVLSRRGCQILEADSVAAASSSLDSQPFDVVITDLGLGDGTGLDVIAHTRRLDPTTPVVVLSGSLDDLELEDPLVWRLSKPASTAQLVDVVSEAGRTRSKPRATPPAAVSSIDGAAVPMPASDATALCDDARQRLTVLSAVASLIRDRRDSDRAELVRPGLCEDQIERQVARLRAILDELAAMVGAKP